MAVSPSALVSVLAAAAVAAWSTVLPHRGAFRSTQTVQVRINDNRAPAGRLRNGTLALELDVRTGTWHPDGDSKPGTEVPAFAERGRRPEIPGPLIRAPAGTTVSIVVRNSLDRDTVAIHGFHDRSLGDGTAPLPIRLAPGSRRRVQFRLDVPGTYYYWGSTMDRGVDLRTREDAMLTGAIVVDSSPTAAPPDRILVLGVWSDTVGRALTENRRLLAVMNGRSWPETERFSYTAGDTVRWRVINASADRHPMHLHGFYFRVDSRGDAHRDTVYRAGAGDLVVTENMFPGGTFSMTWVPERPGNWLFHCHLPEHFAARGPLGMHRRARPTHAHSGGVNHALDEMGGLVVGVLVQPAPGGSGVESSATAAARTLRLLVRPVRAGTGALPHLGFALQEGPEEPPAAPDRRLGPPIVLEQGRPVRINVVNQTAEPTAVHWHGIELESYFDGVAGFSGEGPRISPSIAPNDSFEVRFAPPRAGTFIYHTHVDELRQQRAGLVGPLIVLPPEVRHDSTVDRIVLLTSHPEANDPRVIEINGSRGPAPLELRSGRAYRFRFINMTIRRPALRAELRKDTVLVQWRPLAKDGADLPPARRVLRPARQPVGLGETADVEWTPAEAGRYRLEIQSALGDMAGVLELRVR